MEEYTNKKSAIPKCILQAFTKWWNQRKHQKRKDLNKELLHCLKILRNSTTWIKAQIIKYSVNCYVSTALRCGSLFGKNIKKKHLFRHDKNYYYFCKSNVSVFNLIAGSRNMIRVSKNMSLYKNKINNESHFHQIPTIS